MESYTATLSNEDYKKEIAKKRLVIKRQKLITKINLYYRLK